MKEKILHGLLEPESISIFIDAVNLFDSAENAIHWLISPAMALNGKKPIDCLNTQEGRLEVQQLLGRIEYGVYS